MFVAIPASVALVVAGRAPRRGALPAGRVRRRRRARDGPRAALAGRSHLDGGGGSPDGARALRARRHAHAGHRQRPRSVRVHRAGGGPAGPMGHVGSAWPSPGRARCRWCCCWWAFSCRLGTIEAATLARSAARTLAASLLAGGAGWGCRSAGAGEDSFGRDADGAGVAGMAAFALVFVLAAWGMRAPELEEILVAAFRRRLAR